MSRMPLRLRRRQFVAVFGLIAGMMLVSLGARAEEITFRFVSQVSSPVWVKLFSDEGQKSWPEDGRLFILADSSPQKFTVPCEPGERVCYGAWIEGDFSRYWGAGHEGKKNCDDCCRICEIPSESQLHQVTFK